MGDSLVVRRNIPRLTTRRIGKRSCFNRPTNIKRTDTPSVNQNPNRVLHKLHTQEDRVVVSLTDNGNISDKIKRKNKISPFIIARRYFISRISSYVGRLVGPTLSSISARRRCRISGYSERAYVVNVSNEAV